MYVKSIMYADDQSYVIRNCNIHLPGPKLNYANIPISAQGAPRITIQLDLSNNTYFFRRMLNGQLTSHIRLKFFDAQEGVPSTTYDLYDVKVERNYEFFSHFGDEGTNNTITLVPAILSRNGNEPLQMHWKVQDWEQIKSGSEQKNTATSLQELNSKQSFDEIYLLDESGSKITDIDGPQNVTLVIKTKGMEGKVISNIDLTNEEYDFLYNGKLLKDDQLNNYQIIGEEDHIELEVIEQQPTNS